MILREYQRSDGVRARSLRDLVRHDDLRFDAEGVRFAWGEGGDATRSCVAGIAQRVITNGDQDCDNDVPRARTSLEAALLASVERTLTTFSAAPHRLALCLSGGIDSALVLALVARLGHTLPIYTLAPRLDDPGYSETESALAHAKRFGCVPIFVDADERAFVGALPDAIRIVEAPLYNLHPIARLLLARRMAHDGITHVLTGDGADQLFADASERDDYVPLICALTASTGISVCSPFFDTAVRAAAMQSGPDLEKHALRLVAARYLPREEAHAPKRPCMAPALDLSRYRDEARWRRLADQLSRPIDLHGDRARTAWTTLGLLEVSLKETAS